MPKGARARARAAKSDVSTLSGVAAALAAVELERVELLRRRDELVVIGRAAGRSWADLAREAGTTRQALMERARR
jgi:hypothetical protein